MKDQKLAAQQKKLQVQRENAAKARQQVSRVTSTKPMSNVDRPLAGIRPVAGRQLSRNVGPGRSGAKGRFSKFGF